MTLPFALGLGLGGGHRLILAGLSRWGLWLAAGSVAIGLIAVLYRYERRVVSRKAGLSLLALRVLAVLILVAALFEPIAAITVHETVQGRVIVGVDLSESMSTADDRPAEDRLKLAKLPGASPRDMTTSPSRREVARRLIAGEWASPIADHHDVDAVGFARDSTGEATLKTLADRLATPGKPDDPTTLTTDWTPVLDRALKDDGRPVVGVVLLTDGLSNGPDPGDLSADKLAARNVPIYSVLIGSTDRPKDAAIAAVKAPERVSKGDAADVEVTVKLDGLLPGTEVPVTLEWPGESPLRKIATSATDGSRPVVAFRVAMETTGLQGLTATVGPIPGDVREDNDRRPIAIEVTDDRARVLLIDGRSRWEFQYLRNALARDPQVSVDAVVFVQPALPGGATTYPATLPARDDGKEDGPDPLGSYDVVIIGDMNTEHLNAESWKRLEQYVDTRGGTLVMASGPALMGAIAGDETARKLLPVIDPKPVEFDASRRHADRPALPAGVRILPDVSAASEDFPMLRFVVEADRNRALWSGLPELPWVVAGRPKPLASTLARAEGDEANAVIASQPYGLGKVLWVGTDGTWRWRYRVGDLYHHRFWGQVVRWANAPKLSVGNRLVRFGPTRPGVAEGTGAAILAKFGDDARGIGPGSLVAARIFAKGPDGKPSGDAKAVIALRPRADRPRTFEATAPPLLAGSYLILLDVPQLGEANPKDAAPLEITGRDTPERIEIAADRAPLDRLAAATGGRVYRDVDASALPALLKSRTIERLRTEETPLWDRPWALVLFFGVLSVEWIVRKRAGLP